MTPLRGRCLCGAIRYEVTGEPYDATLCHCSLCRRASGAPLVAWFSVSADEFRLLDGEPASFRSSEHATRTFCSRCGTPLTFRSDRTPDEVDVTTCSLEDPELVPPADHTQVATRLAWLKVADGLPEFADKRS